jgi:hypothetical protein
MMDNKVGKFRLVWGARGEYYDLNGVNSLLEGFAASQHVNNGDLTDYSALYNREPNWHLFPSANLTYSMNSTMNARLAWSKSIIRPDIRETSYFKEYDFELGGYYWSQTPLVSTRITNWDLRYEWYPAAGEVFSVSLFYKHIAYPMEIYEKQNRIFELQNDLLAINKGFEIELRKSFAFTGFPVIKHMTVSGNFTRLYSTVTPMTVTYSAVDHNHPERLYGVETALEKENRPQAGASNLMYNAALYYDHSAFSVSLNYNYISNKLYRVGNAEEGSVYERPLNSLDAQVAVFVLKKRGTVKLNVSNILLSKYLTYINLYDGTSYHPTDGHKPTTSELLYQRGKDVIDYESSPGRSFSVSMSYRF